MERFEFGVEIYNESKQYPVSHGATQAFLSALYERIKTGQGFIPFLGAGFSVTAGIPIINQLSTYLQRCICAGIGAVGSKDELWNPRIDQWPPFLDRKHNFPEEYWLRKVEEPRQNSGKWPALYQEAFGAMAEWRTSLHFLSRLVLERNSDGTVDRSRPALSVPDPDVVDACWRAVMRHKKPTLNHRMLASISGLLRIDLILTTNFDGLIEQAFEESRDPLDTFDVHLGDSLPSLSAVSSQRSIVKLHGSQRSLRADYSLDGPPSEEDIRTFFDYIAGERLRMDQTSPVARHDLLLAGIGGGERRTFEFVRRSLERFEDVEVYWIVFSEREIENISHFFHRPETSAAARPRIHLLRHTDAGLLLLHLYQTIRKSLPVAGSVFPSTTRLSIPPLAWQGHDPAQDPKNAVDLLEKEIHDWAGATESTSRVLVVADKRDVYGVCTAAARVYRSFEASHNCLWLDLNDVYGADNLFESFQEAATLRLSEPEWTPLYIQKDEDLLGDKGRMPLSGEIKRIIQSSPRSWLLFLDAREIPGSNHRELDGATADEEPNGWMDDDATSESSNIGERDAMIKLLQQFAQANERPGNDTGTVGRTIKVVLLCNGNRQSIKFLTGLSSNRAAGNFLPFTADMLAIDPPLPSARTPREVAEDVLGWTRLGSGREDRERIVQVLVWMQRPRHLSVVWGKVAHASGALADDSDASRDGWIDELAKKGLLRRMDGGFIWLQAKYRQALRRCLLLTDSELAEPTVRVGGADPFELSANAVGILKSWGPVPPQAGPAAQQAQLQLELSTWYRKVYDATGVSPAVLEAVEHLCWSARDLVLSNDLSRLETAGERIAAARELLGEHQFLIQSQGHPRASLRRLSDLQRFWIATAQRAARPLQELMLEHAGSLLGESKAESLLAQILKFQSTIAEVKRAIYREIGDEAAAYDALREVSILMSLHRLVSIAELAELKREAESLSGKGGTISLGVMQALAAIHDDRSRRTGDKRTRELVRWYRWCGMLAIASRSHDRASGFLGRALLVAAVGAEFDASTAGPAWSDPSLERLEAHPTLSSWNALNKPDGHKFHLEAMHSLELAAYCCLLRAHTISRAELFGGHPVPPGSTRTIASTGDGLAYSLKKLAETLALKGLKFVEQVQTNGEPTQDHDFELHWCKSRLLMVAGMASELHPDAKEGRHAMSMLSDAAACLKNTTPERGHSDLALVEMRRAEVRLQEAAQKKILVEGAGSTPHGNEPRCLEGWVYDRLLGHELSQSVECVSRSGQNRSFPSPVEAVEEARNLLGSNAPTADDLLRKPLRYAKARIVDALRYLDRAEPILRERRRNVWWTTWYIERRLRAITLYVWITLIEEPPTLPYLGLEEAMAGVDTEVDVLLNDAKRMIRSDSYRLASVILAYAAATRALHIWITMRLISSGATWSRLQRMKSNLQDALVYLESVDKLRHPDAMDRKAQMDEPTRAVIRDSQALAQNVIASIQQ